MSVSCQKNQSITINGVAVDLYWTLDEAGPLTARVDKVHGLVLSDPSGLGIIQNQPGLFSNGLAFKEAGFNIGSDFHTALSPFLARSPNGFSWVFWFKVQHWAAPGSWAQPPFIRWGVGGGGTVTADWDPADLFLFCQDGSVPNSFACQFSDDAGNVYCTANFIPILNAWNMVHIFYDPVAAHCGYQMNNSGFVIAFQGAGPPANPMFTNPVNNLLTIGQVWFAADTANFPVVIDEMLFKLSRMLTPAEISSLWNSGSGRTWPLT